jgi:hypothetical protein
VHEKHGSKLAKIAGTSATLHPLAVSQNESMFANVGVLTFTLSGKAPPLLLT